MNRIVPFAVVLVFMVVLVSGLGLAMNNPAASFCEEEGGTFRVETDVDGDAHGLCITPEGKSRNIWDYYKNAQEDPAKSEPDAGSMSLQTFSSSKTEKTGTLLNKNKVLTTQKTSSESLFESAPATLDWRNHDGLDWITSIKDQASCGACWAFAVLAVFEAKININANDTGLDLDLSEQDLVSCSPTGNCSGGYIYDTMEYIKNNGVVNETCFPYNSGCTGDICNDCSEKCASPVYSRMHYGGPVTPNATAIKNTLASEGPITSYMYVCDDFQLYSGGVYTHSKDWNNCGWHALAVVGYDDSQGYWIVKNSWGAGWGEDGYARINYTESVYDYQAWLDDDTDYRTFFLDDSYYITTTDADNDTINDSYDKSPTVPDTTAPVIHWVNLSDYIFSSGTSVQVTVNATDADLLENVTADGVLLQRNGSLWRDNITLSSSPVSIIASDSVGHSTYDNATEFTIDDTQPQIVNYTVTPQMITNGSKLNISFDIIEENLKNLSVSVDGRDATFIRNTSGRFEYNHTINESKEEGTTIVNVTVVDMAGNSATSLQNLTLDNHPPNITSASIDNEIVRTNATTRVSLNITEGNLVNASANGQELSCKKIVANNHSCRANITVATENITFDVWDVAGNHVRDSPLSVIIDDTLPQVHNVSLSRNVIQSGFDTTIFVNATDNIDIASVMVDDVSLQQDGLLWSGPVRLDDTNISILVVDNASNTLYYNTTLNLSFDDDHPVTEMVLTRSNASVSGSRWHAENVTVSFEVNDSNRISRTEYRYKNESRWRQYSEPFNVSSNLVENMLYYRSIDEAGNRELYDVGTLKLDSRAPSITSADLSSSSVYPGAEVNLFAVINESLSGVSRAIAHVNGTNYTLRSDGHNHVTTITSPATEGSYPVDFFVEDAAGNNATESLSLHVNASVPSIVPSIRNDSFMADETTVTFSSYNITNGTYKLGSGTWNNFSHDNLSVLINESSLAVNFNITNNGTYHTHSFTYHVDETAPVLSVENIADNQTLNGTCEILVDCRDNETTTDTAAVVLDNISKDISSSGYYTLDTFLLADSNHSIVFTCNDTAGNSMNKSYNFTVKNGDGINAPSVDGYVSLENTSLGSYVQMVSHINSSNLSLSLDVNEVPDSVARPVSFRDDKLYLNITASTLPGSRVYFSIPKRLLDGVGLNDLEVYGDHDDSGSFAAKHDLTLLDNTTDSYRFYFTTDSYSEFIIGETYPACDDGEILSDCLCADQVYSSGYCCDGSHQDSSCESDDDSVGGGVGGVGGSVSNSTASEPGDEAEHNETAQKKSEADMKTFTNISSDDVIEFSLDEPEVPVVDVVFMVDSFIPEATLAIQPDDTPETPLENATQYFTIDASDLDGRLSVAKLTLRVNDSWSDHIMHLYVKNGSWHEIPTKKLYERGNHTYYSVDVLSTGEYALAGTKIRPLIQTSDKTFSASNNASNETPDSSVTQQSLFIDLENLVLRQKIVLGFVVAGVLLLLLFLSLHIRHRLHQRNQ
ncbi:MAG: C1 family peptidase [Candidatus Woesearchaeota archaeon]